MGFTPVEVRVLSAAFAKHPDHEAPAPYPIALLTVAVAHQHALAILRYDKDFDLIREHAPLSFGSVWIVPRGSVDCYRATALHLPAPRNPLLV